MSTNEQVAGISMNAGSHMHKGQVYVQNQAGSGDQHKWTQVSTCTEGRCTCKTEWVQTNGRTSPNEPRQASSGDEYEWTWVSTCTEGRHMHKTEQVQTNGRTSANKQVAGTSTNEHRKRQQQWQQWAVVDLRQVSMFVPPASPFFLFFLSLFLTFLIYFVLVIFMYILYFNQQSLWRERK